MGLAGVECPDERIDGMPVVCFDCGAPLCLRKQVLNLALGHVEGMWCLVCLGRLAEKSGEAVLSGLAPYIRSRDCFAKEWRRYPDVGFCPDPGGCFPATCFAGEADGT